MNEELVAKQVEWLWQSVQLLQQDIDYSAVEAFGETLQNLVNGHVQQIDNMPKSSTVEQLKNIYSHIDLTIDTAILRKIIQFTFLKAAKHDTLQINHQMTPDTIALMIAFMVDVVTPPSKEALTIGDFAVGTGNLLATVAHFFKGKERTLKLVGYDNDDVLIHIASQSLTLQQLDVALTLQDSLRPLYTDKLDIVMSDLPVGYYPDDQNAKVFKTSSDVGLSYAHHLLIEQHIHHLKAGGIGIFVVPTIIFETEEASKLLAFLKETVYIQALLQLPPKLFQQSIQQKSLLIIQKQSETTKQASQVLLGVIPEPSHATKFVQFIKTFEQWAKESLQEK